MKNLWLMRSINITNMVVLVYVVLLTTLASGQQFTAMYVYGDSLVDNGNNNYLNAQAKANFLPYGIDFYQGPTGRFTNGKTIIDFLCNSIDLNLLLFYCSFKI